ncbi:MAG TPA: formate C-acetyltransferase, partial [Eubacteriaceae bacterium]|nr:formate C-acetyltransferase [Eubacteriaceae bacterium]
MINVNASPRIQRLKDDKLRQRRELSFERAALYTDSHKKTEGLPSILRRAHATAHILKNVKIAVKEDELIVGDRTIKPRSGIASPEMDPYWIMEELDSIENRPQDQFYVSEEDKKFFREELYPYWENRSLKDFVNSKMPEGVKESIQDGVVKINQTDKGQGHIIPKFEKILDKGLDALIEQINTSRQTDPDHSFLQAASITLEALQAYILRYAQEANKEAEKEENRQRREELLKIESVCRKIAHDKPESFYESIQLFWFVNLALQYESNASSISSGRFDQYMISFYRKSLSDGEDKEFLHELLRCLWLKMNDVV